MSVYLYNLGFSTTDSYGLAGAFEPYLGSQTGLNQSSAWLVYNQQGLPPGVVDNVAPLTALTAGEWNFQQSAGSGMMTLKPGDYVLLRFFPAGSNPSCKLRATAVMGRGTSNPAPVSTSIQAPFMNGTQPRPVIDCDNTTGTNWPTPTGTDGAWTFCIGMIHGNPADYSLNVGATIYITSGGQAGSIMGYGQDPQLHVVTNVQGTVAA